MTQDEIRAQLKALFGGDIMRYLSLEQAHTRAAEKKVEILETRLKTARADALEEAAHAAFTLATRFMAEAGDCPDLAMEDYLRGKEYGADETGKAIRALASRGDGP